MRDDDPFDNWLFALKWKASGKEKFHGKRARARETRRSRPANASQVIAATIESGLIKPDEQVGASRKFARHLPFWA